MKILASVSCSVEGANITSLRTKFNNKQVTVEEMGDFNVTLNEVVQQAFLLGRKYESEKIEQGAKVCAKELIAELRTLLKEKYIVDSENANADNNTL